MELVWLIIGTLIIVIYLLWVGFELGRDYERKLTDTQEE